MKKIITVSLVAMMAVSAARAEIASVEYTTGLTGNLESLATTEKSNLTAAINEVAGKVGSESVADVKSELQGAIDAVDDKADANAGAINTINSGAVMNSGITSEKVAAYDAYAGQIAGKQDALGYTAENAANKANTADAVTTLGRENAYPTVAYMEEFVSTTNNEVMSMVDANMDGAADYIAADTATLNSAKAYTDELANGAVKTNTEAISAINNAETGILAQAKEYANTKAGEASGAAGDVADDLAEYIQSNDAAVEGKADKATTLAGYGITDAMTSTAIGDAISTAKSEAVTSAGNAADGKIATALEDYSTTDQMNTAISTAKDQAVAAAKTAGDAAYDAKGAAATAKSEAIAAAAEAANAAYDTKGAAAQALADAKADAEKYIDATELEQSQTAQNTALQDYADDKVQDLQSTLTSLATFPAACAQGTSDCALVIRSGTMQWEKVAY